MSAPIAQAQFSQSEFRAADGTAYQLLRFLPSGTNDAEKVRVTTVAGSVTGVGSCAQSSGSVGQNASAVAGALPPGQSLHPFDFITRSAILVPNSVTSISFNTNNSGYLAIGSGAGALHICRVPSDCPSGSGVSLVALSSNSGGVPPACIAQSVASTCDGGSHRDTIAFGLPASGDPSHCDNPQNVTTSTFICAPEPSDGFALAPGQALVVVYDGSLGGFGFAVGAAGFGIDTDGSNGPGCAAGSVLYASGLLSSNAGLPPPTSTPTATPTYTPTRTFTPTPTATPTRTPFCGNGIVELPEQCDDGNTASGDCCSPTCTFEPSGSPCADDGNTCTNDQCNGAGVCTHPVESNGTPCNDGNFCTTGEQCVGGSCTGGQPTVCDDHDPCTTDSCVPSIGCLFEVTVESPQCGSCNDGMDNNGDGSSDSEDPNCSTFFALQRFAIIGTATNGLRSVKLGRETKVVENDVSDAELTATIRAGVCGVDFKSSIGVLVTGAVALEAKGRFSGGRPAIEILYQFDNDSTSPSAVITGQTLPLVGPPAKCTNGIDACATDHDCPGSQKCETRLTIDDPSNPNVIKTGMAAEYLRCVDSINAVPGTDQTIAALPQTKALGEIHLRAGGSFEIDLDHGQQIVDIDALRIGQDGRLTIKGFDDTVVVFRIAGAFRIGTRTEVTLSGGIIPANILWVVSGAGRFVRISSHVGDGSGGISHPSFPGTLFAAKRAKISIGAFTTIEGALIGKRIHMGRETKVIHRPFIALLQGATMETPNLAIRSASLRISESAKRNTGGLRLTAIVDDSSAQSFRPTLLANGVALEVKDAAGFDGSVALTNCAAHGDRVLLCRSSSGDTRATIRALRDDPNIYNMSVVRRRLSVAQTGSAQPTAPVTVSMQQAAIQRIGHISTCRKRGNLGLTCRMP